MKSIVVQSTAGMQGLALSEQARRVTDHRRRREKVGDGRAEGSAAIGNRGPAAISLMPNVDETNVHIF